MSLTCKVNINIEAMKVVFINSLKIIFVFIFFLGAFSNGNCQGEWNLKYIPIDSLQYDLIGQEIRIDFKSNNLDTINGYIDAFTIRKLLSRNDTINLTINGTENTFIENWKIYFDCGVLSSQTLVDPQNRLSIKEIYLINFTDSTITVRVNFYKYKNYHSKKIVYYMSKIIVINKSIIKGILFEIPFHLKE